MINTKKIETYERIIKKEKNKEIIFCVAIIFLIVAGVFLDCVKCDLEPIVKSLDSVSLTVLQIQTSVSSISIALIALVSGFVSDEYFGISVANYYLDRKPLFLKQKFLVCVLLFLDGINVLLHIYSLFNAVIAVAWASILLIIFSVIELFDIFKGGKRIYEEVDCYIEYNFFSDNIDIQNRFEIFAGFISNWSEKTLTTFDHDLCIQRYKDEVRKLLSEDDKYASQIINEEAAKFIKKQLSVLDKAKLFRVYEFFDETYRSLWKYILDNKCTGLSFDVTLYQDCAEEIIELINSVDTKDLPTNNGWWKMVDNIIRVNIYCNNIDEQRLKMPDDRTIRMINWFVVSFVESLAERRRKGEIISTKEWKYNNYILRYYYANIPPQILSEYKKNQCILDFSYYYSILKNGMIDISSTVFNNINFSKKIDYEELLFIVLVLLYTYYIGERESLRCIEQEEKDNARKLLMDWKDNEFLQMLIDFLAWDMKKSLIENLEEDLISVLKHYERMPTNGGIKTCILEGIVKDFYLFFISMLIGTSRREELIADIIVAEKAKEFYFDFFGNNFEATKGRLLKIQSVLLEDDTYHRLESGIELVNSIVLKNFKKFVIEESNSNYDIFQNNVIDDSLNRSILKELESSISEWTYKPKKNYTNIRKVLMRIIMPVKRVDEKCIDIFKRNLESNFLLILMTDLCKSGRLKKFVKNKANDDEYLDFIRDNNFMYIVGADYAVNMSSYKNRKRFDDFISENNIVRIPIGYSDKGLVLQDKIGVEISDVLIKYSHVKLSDIRYEINKENGLYRCPDFTGDLEFTKEELEDYLYKEKTMLNIVVMLNYEFSQNSIGFLVKREEIMD